MANDRVPAHTLPDDVLRHELTQLKVKQSEIAESGTAAQQANHAERTSALEEEFLRRFPAGEPADDAATSPAPDTDATG